MNKPTQLVRTNSFDHFLRSQSPLGPEWKMSSKMIDPSEEVSEVGTFSVYPFKSYANETQSRGKINQLSIHSQNWLTAWPTERTTWRRSDRTRNIWRIWRMNLSLPTKMSWFRTELAMPLSICRLNQFRQDSRLKRVRLMVRLRALNLNWTASKIRWQISKSSWNPNLAIQSISIIEGLTCVIRLTGTYDRHLACMAKLASLYRIPQNVFEKATQLSTCVPAFLPRAQWLMQAMGQYSIPRYFREGRMPLFQIGNVHKRVLNPSKFVGNRIEHSTRTPSAIFSIVT